MAPFHSLHPGLALRLTGHRSKFVECPALSLPNLPTGQSLSCNHDLEGNPAILDYAGRWGVAAAEGEESQKAGYTQPLLQVGSLTVKPVG